MLAACGTESTPAGNQAVTIWAWGARAQALQAQAADFNRQSPGVPVKVEDLGQATLYERLTKGLQAGGVNLPDAVLLDYPHLLSFSGIFPASFISLNDLAGSYAGDFKPALWNAGIFLSRQRAIPFDLGLVGLFYRSDLWQPPATWDELVSQGQGWSAAHPNLKLLAIDSAEVLPILLSQQGVSLFTPQDKINLTSPQALRAAELLGRLRHAGLLYNGDSDRLQAAQAGQIAGFVGTLDNYQLLQSRLGDKAGNWRVMPLPALTAEGPHLATLGGTGLGILQTSSQQSRAWQFAQFALTDRARLLANFKQFGLWSAYQPVYSDPAFNDPLWQPFQARLGQYPDLYYNTEYPLALAQAQTAAAAIAGGTDPAQALREAATRLAKQTNRELAIGKLTRRRLFVYNSFC